MDGVLTLTPPLVIAVREMGQASDITGACSAGKEA
jgi:hypothetical protein